MTIYTPRDTNVATVQSISGEYALCAIPGVSRLIACHVSQAGIPRWLPEHVSRTVRYDHVDTRDRHQLIGARFTPEEKHAVNS